MIQNFGGRNFWQNSSQQRLVNNILVNAQNWVDTTKHSLVTHKTICRCDIMCNVSWSTSMETMVRGYHEYFRAGVKFRMSPLSFACYHHQMSNPEVCLCTHWLKKYLKIIFSHSTLHLGQVEAVTSGLTPSMPLTHMCTAYILITNFLKEKILDKKILVILLQFAKNFSLQNFVLYSIILHQW